MNLTPSAAEFDGFYNSNLDTGLKTVRNLPLLKFREAIQIRLHTLARIIKHTPLSDDLSPEEIREYFDCRLNLQNEDRTQQVSLEPFEITLALLLSIKKMLFRRHNAWRVILVGTRPESTIIVYPQVIWIGNLPPGNDISSDLQSILKCEIALRGPRYVYKKAQESFLRNRIAQTIPLMRLDETRCLAHFDCDEGDEDNRAIWFISGRDIEHVKLLSIADYYVSSRLFAKASGVYGYHVSDDELFWVFSVTFDRSIDYSPLEIRLVHVDDSVTNLYLDIPEPIDLIKLNSWLYSFL